ncbi:gamma-glutamylcyclotransferase family protein [Kineosporia sp. A_224]|uniref:gamma-glutamylcyclotransferase family protein n=1 Tax=Kineosporia sp. A_224 TaxID=1962180 RepID=UPI000B4AB30B|nr:gamma-glutamylcyclotransferase family protein [Kineosporia sp. A_224]
MPYVFGYGSLVDRESLEASIGRAVSAADGPFVLRLRGYRRAWNVLGHSSERPEYLFTDDGGSPWEGWLAFLGVEPAAGAATPGAAWRLTDADLEALDDRERSYDRVDVTPLLDAVASRRPDGPVATYMPRDDVVRHAAAVRPAGTVMARYLRLVDRGYRDLGETLYAEHLATLPAFDPLAVREIRVRPVVPGGRNEAVDPDAGA